MSSSSSLRPIFLLTLCSFSAILRTNGAPLESLDTSSPVVKTFAPPAKSVAGGTIVRQQQEQLNLVNFVNSVGNTNQGGCNCNNVTYVCKCLVKLGTDLNNWASFIVDTDVAAFVVDAMKQQEQGLQQIATAAISSDSKETSGSNSSSTVKVASGERKAWPPSKPFKYENKLLGELTGREEPLLHLKMFPSQPKEIGTEFIFTQRRNVLQKQSTSEVKQSNKTQGPIVISKEYKIHYENSSLIRDSVEKCDKLYAIIHGFRGSQEDTVYENLRKNIIHFNNQSSIKSICIVSVDWRKGASIQPMSGFYATAAANTITVGRELAVMIYYLVNYDVIEPSQVHILGFSLGAQAAHFAGVWFKQIHNRVLTLKQEGSLVDNLDVKVKESSSRLREVNWTIGRITGLDPAARDFSTFNGSYLTSKDANFVDVIHSSTCESSGSYVDILNSRFGMAEAVGSIDFYPNGGSAPQPECDDDSDISCSHNRAIIFFTDSLDSTIDESSFISVPCDSYEHLDSCQILFLSPSPSSSQSASESSKKRAISSMGISSIDFQGRGMQYLNYTSKQALASLAANSIDGVTSKYGKEEDDAYDYDGWRDAKVNLYEF